MSAPIGPAVCQLLRWVDSLPSSSAWPGHDDPVAAVRTLLADTYTERGIDIWLRARNRRLGDESPANLVSRGEHHRVLAEARRIAQ